MDDKEQKRAAQKFVEFWKGKGYEKGQTQAFWLSLLREVFDVKEPEKVISFEDQVVLKNTNFIDAYIPSTRVLILKTRKTSLGRSSKARNLEKPLETGAFRLHQVSVHCITYTLILEQNSWQPPRNTLSKSARFPSSIKRREC